MDKLKKYSKWIKIFHVIFFFMFLLGAVSNLVRREPQRVGTVCSADIELVDFKCWSEKHDASLQIFDQAGVNRMIIWLPLFALAMFGLWQFIRLMGAFQVGTIFSHENFLRMRWIGRVYLILCFGESIYIAAAQATTKLFNAGLSHADFKGSNSSQLLPGLLFLIMAYAVQAAVQMKQELEEVV